MSLKKSVFSLLIAVVATLGLGVSYAFADDASVTFKDNDVLIAFAPGSVYTETDLFDNFKCVMPGDMRTENITVQNSVNDHDYIKVYMYAVMHDEAQNPLSESVQKKIADDTRKEGRSDIEYMYDFLKQMTLTLRCGSETIYQDTLDSLDGLENPVLLGTLQRGESLSLTADLEVSPELGNEYARRIGEVDWVFVVEGYDNPEALPSLIQTGQLMWPVLVFGGLGVVLVAFGIYVRRKKRKNGDG